MCYAIKCDISRAELEADCFELMEFFENKPAEYANLVHLNDLFLHLSYLGDKNLIEEYQSEFNNVIIKVISRIKRI